MSSVRRLLILTPALLAGALLPGATATASGPVGLLGQFGLPSACVEEAQANGCQDGHGFGGAGESVTDPSKGFVLSANPANNSVTVMRRDTGNGVLTQPPDEAGCVAPTPINATLKCRDGHNLAGVTDLVVTPDGKHVYAAGTNGIAAFAFKSDTGLTPLGGREDCLSNNDFGSPGNNDNDCRDGRGMNGLNAIATSPDGGRIYATTAGTHQGLVMLTRDGESGNVRQPDAGAGCITRTGEIDGDGTPPAEGGNEPQGCGGARLELLGTPTDLIVGRDGTLYVAHTTGLLVLKLKANGELEQTGCVVQAKSDSTSLDDSCLDARAIGSPSALALSNDGSSLYVANSGATMKAVAQFIIGADGSLSQPAASNGCIAAGGSGGANELPCASLRNQGGEGLAGTDIAVAPDGQSVVVTGRETTGEINVLNRAADGGLTQDTGVRGCASLTGQDSNGVACVQTVGTGPAGFAFGDAHQLYARSQTGIGFLTRQVSPTCRDTSAATDTQTPVTVSFDCSDLNGDLVSISVVGPATKGATGGPTADRKVTYTPTQGTSGLDTFLVRPSDGQNNGPLATATLNVTFKAGPAPPPEGRAPHPTLVTRTLKPDAKGRVRVSLRCASTAPVNCRGRLQILTVKVRTTGKSKKKKRVLIALLNYDVAPGKQKRYTAKLSKTARKALTLKPRINLTVETRSVAEGKLSASTRSGGATLKKR